MFKDLKKDISVRRYFLVITHENNANKIQKVK